MFEIFLCIIISDFITGLFHWFEDTYGTISDSWLSKNFWEPNILHHKDPSFIVTMSNFIQRNYLQWLMAASSFIVTMSNFIQRNYLQWLMAASFLVIVYFLGFFCWQLVLIAVLTSLANEVHSWNHAKKNNWFVDLLQDMCLVQNKLHHAKHHRPPYDKNYCILTNWVNPILERIYFWKALEWILSPILSVKRGSKERDGF